MADYTTKELARLVMQLSRRVATLEGKTKPVAAGTKPAKAKAQASQQQRMAAAHAHFDTKYNEKQKLKRA